MIQLRVEGEGLVFMTENSGGSRIICQWYNTTYLYYHIYIILKMEDLGNTFLDILSFIKSYIYKYVTN